MKEIENIDIKKVTKSGGFYALNERKSLVSPSKIETKAEAKKHKVPVGSTTIAFRNNTLQVNGAASVGTHIDPQKEYQNVITWDSCRDFFINNSTLIKSSNHVIFEGVLERLEDPRQILAESRTLLLKNKTKKITWKFELNENANMYGKWDETGAIDLLMSSGFNVITSKWPEIVVECNQNHYDSFLASRSLPKSSFKHLLVTTEHPDYRITGGLGSYIKECSNFYGAESAIFIVDNNRDINNDIVAMNKWMSLQSFLREDFIEQYIKLDHNHLSEVLYRAIESVIFYYNHNLESIEFQEGAAFRVLQSKKAGLFPSWVKLVTTCHGSSFFLAYARKDFVEPELVQNAYREKYCVEKSDLTIFPTNYLKNVYESIGVVAENGLVRRLPFAIDVVPQSELLERYRRLVYVGKTNATKGFDIFLSSLLKLHEYHPNITAEIEEVVAIVTYPEIHEPYIQKLYDTVQNIYNIKVISLSRDQLMATLSEYAHDSLALITYPGDNHPTVILELMAIGHDFIALDAGGTPDLVKNRLDERTLCKPDAEVIANTTAQAFEDYKERITYTKEQQGWYLEQQKAINSQYSLGSIYKHLHEPSSSAILTNSEQEYTVVVPVFNTPMNQIADLCKGILGQTLPPYETLFINDGSTEPNYENTLTKTIKKYFTNQKAKVITQPNKGLAGARNAGLEHAKTDLVIPIDSDDIPLNTGFEYLINAINNNTSAVATTGYCKYFTDEKDDPTIYNFMAGEHLPVGAMLGAPFYPQNNFGSALCCVRKSTLTALGGWDDSDKSMWEDWAFYIKLANSQQKVVIVPEVVYMYRVREDSMMRSYPAFPAQQRLIRNMTALPLFDSYILFSQLKAFNEIYFEGKLPKHLLPEEGTAELGGIEKVAIVYRNVVPRPIRAAIFVSARAGYRSLRMIYRLTK